MQNYKLFESFPRINLVRKEWGYEIWFFNTNELCMKLLVVYPGWTCSYHEHPRKYEIFYILDSDSTGRMILNIDGKEHSTNPGDYYVIERNTPHEFTVRGDKPGSMLEFSTQHRDDDSVRHTFSRLLSLGMKGHDFMGELSGFSDVKVLVAGDVMYDIYWTGKTEGLSPEAPVPNVYPDSMWDNTRPGGAGNVVSNILSLGGKVACVAYTGDDMFGNSLTAMMKSQGCNVDYMQQFDGRPTTTKIRIMDGPHHHCRVNFERRDDLTDSQADSMYLVYMQALADWKPDIIYFADYDKGLLCKRFLQQAIAMAIELDIPTIADPKLAHPWDFQGVTLYKPNVNRLATTLDRKLDTETAIQDAAKEILGRVGPEFILITRGAYGMSLFRGGMLDKHIPGKTVNVWELSGAGDTVGAVLSLCMGSDIPVQRAAEIANVAGSLIVQKPGTSTLTQSELLEQLSVHNLDSDSR